MAMKSIFHVQVATPEELRDEFVKWHEEQRQNAIAELERHKRPSNATVAAYSREIDVHFSAAEFWRGVIIDSPETT